MYTIGIRELRSNLATIVRAATLGQTTTISQHGRPVAQVGPVGADASTIDQLIASRSLHRPSRSAHWRPPEPTPIAVGARIDLALRDLRG